MPSTSSSVVSVVLPSSTVMTPSLPTFSIASASRSPITRSLFALIAPTWAISSLLETFLDILSSCSVGGVDGLVDAAADRHRIAAGDDVARAFAKIARASTVAVVVPSPASVEVLSATSCTSLAPMFSNGSSSSISLLTVTPSLVTVGPPNDLLMITLRPVGPSVMATASASLSTPASILARAASSNISCFATYWIPV